MEGAFRSRCMRRSSGPVRYVSTICALVFGATSCAPHVVPAELRPEEIEATLLLIGDAGEPDPRHVGAPLDSLRAHAAAAPQRTTIVFLGDNVYPDGIPEEGAAEFRDARRRLQAQVLSVPPGARGIFIPGNHDWHNSDPYGLYAIRQQARLIEQLAGGRDVRMLPENGCPGPASIDAGRLRVVAIDSHWWLHNYIVTDEASNCPTNARSFVPALREHVRPDRADQVVVVAAHHPLLTGGGHGGYCGITGPWRRLRAGSQDILSSRNRAMRDTITAAFNEHPPLIFAAGHDHNLQVLRGAPHTDWHLVSGAGSYSKAACVVHMRESEWVSQYRSGFMRLDVLRGRGVLLSVYASAVAQTEPLEPTRYELEVLRLESTPAGALPRMALPMPASRDRHYWGVRAQAGYRGGRGGGTDLPTVAGGIDLQWRGRLIVGATAGYQSRDCELLGPDCGGHALFGTQMRFAVITGGSSIGRSLGDNSATTSVGTEIGFGYAPGYIPGSSACTFDFGLPVSLSMLQTVRVNAYATPAVAWDVDCGGAATGRASYMAAAGLGIQQLLHQGLDASIGVQKLLRRGSGYQVGISLTYTKLPSRRVRRVP